MIEGIEEKDFSQLVKNIEKINKNNAVYVMLD